MKRVALLTSGGDAPGMNAAVRAAVRTGLSFGWSMVGVRRGYAGLLEEDLIELGHRSVGGIIQQGGTFLGSSRCPEMETESGQRSAVDILSRHAIDALVVVGGNGSQTGAHALSVLGPTVIGIGSTIDNDLVGSDVTIGVDTALNIALEAIDRLKVTAASHRRAFFVEVMGRECGYLALIAGITGGAEAVVLPGVPCDPDELAARLQAGYGRGKRNAIVVVAEGAHWNARRLGRHFRKHHSYLGFDLRLTILGHVQRGGTPSSFDRLLATRLGAEAIRHLSIGTRDAVLGVLDGHVEATPLSEVAGRVKPLDPELVGLAEILAA
jgi:6-phosphofructokinase 1